MNKKLRIKVKKGWIAYPGSTLQNNYAEPLEHGYLLWDIKSSTDFNVEFKKLPNFKPFITIDWMGSVVDTLNVARDFPICSRFRVKHKDHISHKETISLTNLLKNELSATEVTFKNEQQNFNDFFTTNNNVTVTKQDLRNPEIILHLIKDFHKDIQITEDVWNDTLELLNQYMRNIDDDGTARNIFWSIKHLKFDNIFCYGENNVINFNDLSGIVGIFGPNRSGKSSLPGALMYSLFNTTDRGSIKNLHVCNIRKQYCYSRVILCINGIDYAIERQTTKNELKNGDINAATSLNFFRIDNSSELSDLSGIQRSETEKTLRKYIGSFEDIALTSLSSQGEINQIIELGSTKRNHLLSRFLDLDIFYKINQLASADSNSIKSVIKQIPEKDWAGIGKEKLAIINNCDDNISLLTIKLSDLRDQVSTLKNNLLKHHNVIPVTKEQLDNCQLNVSLLKQKIESKQELINSNIEKINKIIQKISTIETLRNEYNIVDLRKQQESLRNLELTVNTLKNKYTKEELLLKNQKRSLKILDTVPCGDKFPSCHYIKDAYENKSLVEDQSIKVQVILKELKNMETSVDDLKSEGTLLKIKKLEELNDLYTSLTKKLSDIKLENFQLESVHKDLIDEYNKSNQRLIELKEAINNDENVEIISIKNEIDSLEKKIALYDQEKIDLATLRGKEKQAVETLANDRKHRQKILKQLKIHELIASACSKKGIPCMITSDRLPAINSEIAKILSGIVDFTVELQRDDSTDQLDIYLNYGDSRRLVELGSGMEKAFSSIALRVALINVSSLPKSDFFIIDEGFGVFDDLGLEAVTRLLQSLKKYFRCLIVISHIDAIKDVADHVIEITKTEKDSSVKYE